MSILAGRCVQYLQVQVVPTDKILIIMGTKDLTKWKQNGAVTRKAKSVHVHPDFMKDFKSANADVALITLGKYLEGLYIHIPKFWPSKDCRI